MIDGMPQGAAIITGGASGIGRATALEFARRDVDVLVADLDADAAAATAAQIRELGARAATAVVDVRDDDAFERLLAAATDELGEVHYLMNNAGMYTSALPEHTPLEEWRRIFEINLFAISKSVATFVPYFQQRGAGHFINTASFAGMLTYSYDRLPYASSKAAIVQVSEGLALYLRPQGIDVTVLAPGPVRTNLRTTVRRFGPETITRGPGPRYEMQTPEQVATKLLDSVGERRFMVFTHDQVRDDLLRRAIDWERYIDEQTEVAMREPEGAFGSGDSVTVKAGEA